MKLYIKNMVCPRCKMMVKAVIEQMGVSPISVELGEVEINQPLSPMMKEDFIKRLAGLGFELIDDKKSQLIEQIKTLIIDLVHHRDNSLPVNLSTFLSAQLGQDYQSLSQLFSEVEDTTIEKFYISHKIERVKELLIYNELTLSEIAFRLHYSSVGHLSSQFKKVTGFTPSHYKQLRDKKRIQLDKL